MNFWIRATGRKAQWFMIGLAVMGFLGHAVSPAAAGTCLEQVRELAEAHDLNIDPPDLRDGSAPPAAKPRDLGKSGGVIEPPKVNDPAVIEPPGGVRYGMPTLPEVPSTAPPPAADGQAQPLGARDRAVLESILVAARAEAEREKEADCFTRLQMAQEFLKEKR